MFHRTTVRHFVCSLISQWAFGFPLGAVMDDAVVNMTVVLCGCMLPFLLGKYLGVELLGPVITLFFISWVPARLAFQSGYTILLSYQQCRGSQFPYFLINTWHCLSSDSSFSSRCEVVVWICIFLMLSDVEHFSLCLLAISISSLEKCLLRSFAHF